MAYMKRVWIGNAEPKPIWNVVEVLGYDKDDGKMLMLDRNRAMFPCPANRSEV